MNLSTIKDMLDPNHARYVTGTPEDRERARREWHRQRFIAQVMRSDLEEIPATTSSRTGSGRSKTCGLAVSFVSGATG